MKMRLNTAGDTIVEVLLAVVVVGAVLTGAYVSSNQSLNADRASQERAEALKYVESQIDQVKANVAAASAQPTGSGFCFKQDGTIQVLPGGTPSSSAAADDFSKYTNCDPGSIPDGYNLSVVRNSANDVYTVRARWTHVAGSNRDEIVMLYRVTP